MLSNIANAGANTLIGEICIYARASLIIEPHSALGGLTPSPKKERPAIAISVVPICVKAFINRDGIILGNICLLIMQESEQRFNLAAAIKASFFILNV